MPKLILYYRPLCPYCQKVIQYIKDNKVHVELKDITGDSDIRRELIAIGGKTQVPCLSIDGEALYESYDIIRWMTDNM